MTFDDEKDYIKRVIKEMARVLFSLMLGKKYVAVEMERNNGYEVSGRKLNELLGMIDCGVFLTEHDFSKEEVLDGMNRLLQKSGYGDVMRILAMS